jgi:hypothetical protein
MSMLQINITKGATASPKPKKHPKSPSSTMAAAPTLLPQYHSSHVITAAVLMP